MWGWIGRSRTMVFGVQMSVHCLLVDIVVL